MPQNFHLFPCGREGQRIAFGMPENKQTVSSKQFWQLFVVEQLLRQRIGTSADVLLAKRRIGHDQIEGAAKLGELMDRGESVLHPDFVILARQSAVGQVL